MHNFKNDATRRVMAWHSSNQGYLVFLFMIFSVSAVSGDSVEKSEKTSKVVDKSGKKSTPSGGQKKSGKNQEKSGAGEKTTGSDEKSGELSSEKSTDASSVGSNPSGAESVPASQRGSSGVGGQGYIESVSGVVTIAMSNQEANMGVISEIRVSEGQSVQKETILAVSSYYAIREKQLFIAQSELDLAKTDLQISENKAVACSKQLKRHEKMVISKAISAQDFENIQKDSIEADLLVSKQKTALQIAEQKVLLCEKLLEQSQIRAPMDGVILKINGKVGEQFRANDGLVIMADLDQLEIVSEVHENDISKIFMGQKAEISFPNKIPPIMGYVKYIASIVRSNTLLDSDPKKDHDLRVVEVRLAISGEDSMKIRNFLRMHTDVRFFGPDERQKNSSITSINQARAV